MYLHQQAKAAAASGATFGSKIIYMQQPVAYKTYNNWREPREVLSNC